MIKTTRRIGIRDVGVYSKADRDALHVEIVDEAGPSAPPIRGYGFLSEHEAFATAFAAAGIVFIGPNPHAIAAVGDRIESKKAAAGVSSVLGFLGVIEGPEHAITMAGEIGIMDVAVNLIHDLSPTLGHEAKNAAE